MHAAIRRSRGFLALSGLFAGLIAALVIALPTPATAATVWHGAVPSWVAQTCRTGAKVICIDKTTRKLVYMINGKAELTMDARFGGYYTPTREGTFHVYYKDADHVSSLYGSPMPFSMFFSGGEAIHYSIDFATYGYLHHSHGCVNIRDYSGVRWLYSQIPVGTRVVVYH